MTAARVAQFVDPGEHPLKMPTGVAVLDGNVIVADGVNDRLVVFNERGEVVDRISEVGTEKLSRPVNVAADRDGRLWIADTGHGRVLARARDGSLARMIPMPRGPADHVPEVTDIAVAPDASYIWLVDNHNHRLTRVDLPAGTTTTLGQKGEALGQFHHPFMAAVGPDGTLLVTDVLNARLDRFNSFAAPSGNIGNYGVSPGQLYRPKGVEFDSSGNIWVSDSVMGVVQVFSPNGAFIDVLRDLDGKPLHFKTPMGMAFDPDGHLYVVELGANAVAKLDIKRRPIDEAALGKPRPQVIGAQARSCTVCHIEWIEPLASKMPTELIAPPEDTAEQPNVSRAETCLSCHDASVVDSRRKVWLEHSHRTGVKPPDTMRVPNVLPLVDGKIACRTCHSAHANGQFGSDAATAVFLRVANSASELCITCHEDKTRGPRFGTHPTGGMPWAIPQKLIDSGAKPGPNPRELTCTVCHTPHGSVNDHLLVLGTSSNQLCVTCHDQIRPGMFRDDQATTHPLRPVVNAEQKSAVETMGTKLGPEDRLICLSCHKLHHGKDVFLLAQDLTDGKLCLGCHSAKQSVLATSHDLRERFPEEKNRLGMTPTSGGPCSACHLFHRYARPPEVSDVDPGGGKCISCHQEGRCAGTKTLGPVNHPTACVTCHDPHKNQPMHFLRAAPGELCVTCHSNYKSLDKGPHDYRTASVNWPQAAAKEEDRCMRCHRPHGDTETMLFRVTPSKSAAAPRDGACIACHPKSAWHGDNRLAAQHPEKITRPLPKNNLPLVFKEEQQEIGCRTCHNPHKPDGAHGKFLRVESGEPGAALCMTCHQDKSAVQLTSHSEVSLGSKGMEAEACLPCHSVHAAADAIRPSLMWPKSLTSGQTAGPASDCTACHRAGGPAKVPAIAIHPRVNMWNFAASDSPDALRLYDEKGAVSERGSVTCKTCHAPHGHLADEELAKAGRQLSPESFKGARLMLRPFVTPNICTGCHGADALRRFLYFHDPSRRSGPLPDPTERPLLGSAVFKS
ncbi:MAG TPA: cytochrome c3 family protein [Phycisphaerae bacterium]|nr:cytochrome c3 family protein [Phycisphaerae bacterium]